MCSLTQINMYVCNVLSVFNWKSFHNYRHRSLFVTLPLKNTSQLSINILNNNISKPKKKKRQYQTALDNISENPTSHN